MIKRSIPLLAGLAACAPEPSRSTLELATWLAAERLDATAPDTEGFVTLVAARAEGRTLVLELAGLDDWRAEMADA